MPPTLSSSSGGPAWLQSSAPQPPLRAPQPLPPTTLTVVVSRRQPSPDVCSSGLSPHRRHKVLPPASALSSDDALHPPTTTTTSAAAVPPPSGVLSGPAEPTTFPLLFLHSPAETPILRWLAGQDTAGLQLRTPPPGQPSSCRVHRSLPQWPATSMRVYSGNFPAIFSRPLSSGIPITHAASTTCGGRRFSGQVARRGKARALD